jgi:hypothetical protein
VIDQINQGEMEGTMLSMLRGCGLTCLTAALLIALASGFPAGPRVQAATADDKEMDEHLNAVLKEVINAGADLYNVKKDYYGCYQLYRSSLVTARPLLKHHPKLQRAIDTALARADREPSVAERPFILRAALDEIRTTLRASAAGTGNGTDKKGGEDIKKPKDTDQEKPKDKMEGRPKVPPEGPAKVAGKVTLDGKEVPNGFVTFVAKDTGRKFCANIIKDGTYRITKGIPEGEFVVLIEEPVGEHVKNEPPHLVPAMYRTVEMSPLRATLNKGDNPFDIELKTK